jgi:hypothetical protein
LLMLFCLSFPLPLFSYRYCNFSSCDAYLT